MGAGRTETSVAPWRVGASRDFHFISSKRAASGAGEGALSDFFFLFYFLPCSADHGQNWPPCKVVISGWQRII